MSIVMEFMAGGNLKDLLKEKKQAMGKEFTVTFIEDIGSAIEYLHSLGVMHRDVRPENILVSTSFSFSAVILSVPLTFTGVISYSKPKIFVFTSSTLAVS